ncbi:hypothetical protein HKX48_007208 [Thoreauomyces humboldtii]|nr:hypothetical protein HKX48_007208 [Thoreauomyces humboldtii]
MSVFVNSSAYQLVLFCVLSVLLSQLHQVSSSSLLSSYQAAGLLSTSATDYTRFFSTCYTTLNVSCAPINESTVVPFGSYVTILLNTTGLFDDPDTGYLASMADQPFGNLTLQLAPSAGALPGDGPRGQPPHTVLGCQAVSKYRTQLGLPAEGWLPVLGQLVVDFVQDMWGQTVIFTQGVERDVWIYSEEWPYILGQDWFVGKSGIPDSGVDAVQWIVSVNSVHAPAGFAAGSFNLSYSLPNSTWGLSYLADRPQGRSLDGQVPLIYGWGDFAQWKIRANQDDAPAAGPLLDANTKIAIAISIPSCVLFLSLVFIVCRKGYCGGRKDAGPSRSKPVQAADMAAGVPVVREDVKNRNWGTA